MQDTVTEQQDTKGKVRVDGSGMKRETLFGNSSSPGSWLSESDVDFFTGGTNLACRSGEVLRSTKDGFDMLRPFFRCFSDSCGGFLQED